MEEGEVTIDEQIWTLYNKGYIRADVMLSQSLGRELIDVLKNKYVTYCQ